MATILVVDDDPALRRFLTDRLEYLGHHVEAVHDGESALSSAGRRRFDLVLLDLGLPGMDGLEVLDRFRALSSDEEIVVLTAHGSVEKVVDAMRRGADDFLTKPADMTLLEKVLERALEKRRLTRAGRARADGRGGFVPGSSPVVRGVMETLERAAKSPATILLHGESGTGKQVFAEWIHAHSDRVSGPFVYVNCVAISDELIESTLFGHERGAFTGAVQRKEGRLEAASGGTAFLDEIGDISPRLQTKLLHFLETNEFERVGGGQTLRVDARIVAATNRDLAKDVAEGRVREDLYYRLNVVAQEIPPLRDRREDIPVLAEAFVAHFASEMKRAGVKLDEETVRVLGAFDWPGNVRQLKNAIERMVVLAPGTRLGPELLPPEIRGGAPGGPDAEGDAGAGEGTWKP
ncbi:sigma-54 dependent transcriptional regulator, partial [bacterium]|nr:sigma-54 dependent transcriptional regulator [bacterium]